jgi:hypothetical protein
VKAAGILGIKRGNIWKTKLMSLQRTVRTESEKGYYHRTNFVKDENGDLLAESHNTFNSWKNSQLLNVPAISDVKADRNTCS